MKWHAICLSGALLAVGLAYANSFEVPFQFDDVANIVENPGIRDLGSFLDPEPQRERLANSQYQNTYRRYLAGLSLALNYRAHGLEVFGYHLVNLGIHLANMVLVYLLAHLLLLAPRLRQAIEAERVPWVALAVASLFALHPIQTQAVTYIVQRHASLVALFYLLAVVAFLGFRLASGRRRRVLLLGISLVSSTAAMISKENAFTLPFAILLIEVILFDGSWRARALPILLYLPMLAIIPARVPGLWGVGANPFSYGGPVSFWSYFLTSPGVALLYLRLLLLPFGQSLDHDRPWVESLAFPGAWLPMIVVLALVALAVWMLLRSSRKTPMLALVGLGILWFFLVLSVETSFLPLPNAAFEHRVYLPSVGFFLVVVGLGVSLLGHLASPNGWRLSGGLVVVASLTLLGLTHARNEIWRDPVSLWSDAARKAPEKARPHNNLATALGERGDYTAAEESFRRALELDAEYAEAHLGLARTLTALGRSAEAEQHFEAASRGGSLGAAPFVERGNALKAAGDLAGALVAYEQAVRMNPRLAGARFNLGVTLLQSKRPAEAGEQLEACVRLDPDRSSCWVALSDIQLVTRDPRAAEATLRSAIERLPREAELHYQLGSLLGPLGRLPEAVSALRRAVELAPKRASYHGNLGTALYLSGEDAEAIEHFRRALELGPPQASTYSNLSLALRRQGRTDEADRARGEALRLDPSLAAP